jgi:hypothetical protein
VAVVAIPEVANRFAIVAVGGLALGAILYGTAL